MIQQNALEIFKIFLTVLGGGFALLQWKKSNDYKRAELLQNLITKMRDDEDISLIMDLLDWNEGITYDGKIHIAEGIRDYRTMSSDEAFVKLDKALAHMSYMCYLKSRGIFKNKDMEVFNYHIKRVVENEHIANYLYSLYHWAKSLNVNCSHEYLIRYALHKGFLSKSFTVYSDKGCGQYTPYLLAMEDYANKFK